MLYAIALTGGIATGKSTTCNFLKDLGYAIIDLDKISSSILDQNALTIEKMFGECFFQDGILNRKMFSDYIFSNDKEKKRLEDFLHPLIFEKVKANALELDKKRKFYFLDIPLFFESKQDYKAYKIVVVACDNQLERLMNRSNLTPFEAQKRINSQIPLKEKIKKADFVIDNNFDLSYLKSEVARLDKFLKDKYESVKI